MLSDDDDDDANESIKSKTNSAKFDSDTLEMLENCLEDVITESLQNVNIKQQMDWNRQILCDQIDKNAKDTDDIFADVKYLQSIADKMSEEIFQFKTHFTEEHYGVDLNTNKPFRMPNYPPNGDFKHSEISFYLMYLSYRNSSKAPWIPCRVSNKVEENGETKYAITFQRPSKDETSNKKIVSLEQLAYGRGPGVRLKVGTRVVALFRNDDDKSKKNRIDSIPGSFHIGVVAEQLCKFNKWRYLVFFDDGYAQYIEHDDVRVLCKYSENVWEDIVEAEGRTFMQNYLTKYRDKRSLVQVKKNQKVCTEFNGKWYMATVHDVDANLVYMHFNDIDRYEHIYRGSLRLGKVTFSLNLKSFFYSHF